MIMWHRKKQQTVLDFLSSLKSQKQNTQETHNYAVAGGWKVIFSQTDGEGTLEKVDLMQRRCNEYIHSANFLCNYCLIPA